MTKTKIVVVGSANMDIYTWTDHLPERGETVIGDRYWMGMGGKGANQAVGSSRLGADAALVGRVGQDSFGRELIETLQSYDVTCKFIREDSESGSGVALVFVDKEAENIIAVVPGTNMRVSTTDVDMAAGLLQAADVILTQLEIPIDTIEHAMAIANEGKTLRILNPAPARLLPDSLIQKVDILTPNQTEAKILTGIDASTIEGAEQAGKALLAKGVKTVIITLGKQGALLVESDKSQHIPGYAVDSIDASGAGDAFMAGLGVALGENKSMIEAVHFANAVGALSTTRPGATPSMPSRQEVEAFMHNAGR
jgi:ribokinase